MPNSPVAISDVGTMLYCKGTTVYEELVGITSAPATGSSGGTIEVTELKSTKKQFIADRPDVPEQDFIYNRTDNNYTRVSAKCDGTDKEFLVKYSDGTGTYIKGTAQTWKNDISRGSALEATLHIVAVQIEDKTAAEVTTLLSGSTSL